MSCRSLAETLGPKFVAAAIEMYEMEESALGEASWMAQSARARSPREARQEWMFFCLFAYIQGFRASMAEDQVHFSFMHEFLEVVGETVASEKLFQSTDDFSREARERTSTYLNALQRSAPATSMRSVASMFLANAGCNPEDLALNIGAVGSFTNRALGTKRLFEDIGKNVRLVI